MTTPHQRERNLEAWLRHIEPDTAPAKGPCLDAETAAAWADGALGHQALEQAQTHVGGCARCQALMRTLIQLEDSPATALAAPGDPGHSWRRWLTWAVPLAATATALFAVVVWTQAPPTPESPDTSVAAEVLPSSAAEVEADSRAAEKGQLEWPTRESTQPTRRVDAVALKATQAQAESLTPAPAPASAAAGPSVPAAATQPPQADLASRLEASQVAVAEIRSPDPSVRWRIAGGRVERTVDSGATWSGASIPSMVPIAGSAPSASVCWVVGRGGVVVRTTDGSRWTRLPFPDTADLVDVTATSAGAATVVAADGRIFGTADGGATWTTGR